MPLDFSRLTDDGDTGALIEPRQVFASLSVDRSRYPYMRDVQGETLERWFARRNDRDVVLKMNTGGGKTVVGLLALQSSLNEGFGPALYLCPDKYLVDQVAQEAAALGIPFTSDPRSPEYRTSGAICITVVHKLFNGKSVFGVGQGARLPIGTVLIDDAHACLATVQSQFTVTVSDDSPEFKELFAVLTPSLEQQSRARLEEIRAGDPRHSMPVPSWTWITEQHRIVPILARHASREGESQFTWPLIRDVIELCRAAVSARQIQITPMCLPTSAIPSFQHAKRRLYLTATLADDSALVTAFDANPESLAKPIVPTSASDLGDRLILSPLETHPTLDHSALRQFLKDLSKRHNAVVIAPSDQRAKQWADVADRICTADTVGATVEQLRAGHVGLVVFANRYDGIDLPGSACRVLVIDGLPGYSSPIERTDAELVDGTDQVSRSQMQLVEQGMGRGVRSNDDYCVVVLSDLRLAADVWTHGERFFTPATAAQLRLSRRLTSQLRNTDLTDLRSAVDSVLGRDATWVKAARGALAPLTSPTESSVSPVAVAQRKAFDLAEAGRQLEAAEHLLAAAGTIDDAPLRGWIKQQAAAHLYAVDAVRAEAVQGSARQDNRSTFRPRTLPATKSLHRANRPQGENARQWLLGKYETPDRLRLPVEALLDRLRPDPNNTVDFERAFAELGQHLGFDTRRPEQEDGEGPDVWWSLGELRYLVVECKSGSTSGSINKTDLAQLGHSADWFDSTFDRTCSATPVVVHPANRCGQGAVAAAGMRVMTFDLLDGLCMAVRGFAQALATQPTFETTAINERLQAAGLHANGFADRWTTNIRPAKG